MFEQLVFVVLSFFLRNGKFDFISAIRMPENMRVFSLVISPFIPGLPLTPHISVIFNQWAEKVHGGAQKCYLRSGFEFWSSPLYTKQ